MTGRRLNSAWRAASLLCCMHVIAASPVTAGVWEWGCIAPAGKDQIIFNRDALVVVTGNAPSAQIDTVVHAGDQLAAKMSKSAAATTGAYSPDESNDGLSAKLSFTPSAGGPKLVLTELTSKQTSHKMHVVANCRDEAIDRFRKSYRVERGQEPAVTVTFECMEYQLSTRGGRTCQ